MLKMEYFNLRLLLGVLRSKQVSGRWCHHSVYSVNVRGSFKLSTGEGAVLPPGAVMPQHNFSPTSPVLDDLLQLLPAQPHLRDVCHKVTSPAGVLVSPLSLALPVPHQELFCNVAVSLSQTILI